MSDTMERGTELLRRLEQDLRVLVREAASTGDYESVMALTFWARSIASLIARRLEQATAVLAEADDVQLFPANRSRDKKASTARRKPAKGEYPRFLRQANNLVKVGWSRRGKEEYEHKVSEGIVMLIARGIAKAGLNGELTPTEKFLSAVTSEGAAEVPEYQVYVVLAWLRSLGLVTQHGRRGYTISQPNDLTPQVRSFWEQLPKK